MPHQFLERFPDRFPAVRAERPGVVGKLLRQMRNLDEQLPATSVLRHEVPHGVPRRHFTLEPGTVAENGSPLFIGADLKGKLRLLPLLVQMHKRDAHLRLSEGILRKATSEVLHLAVRLDDRGQQLPVRRAGAQERLLVEQAHDVPVVENFPRMEQVRIAVGEGRVHEDEVILFVRPEREEIRAHQRIALAPDRGLQLRLDLDAVHQLTAAGVVIALQLPHGGVGKVALPRRGFENRASRELAGLGKHLLRHFGRRGIKRGVVHVGSF